MSSEIEELAKERWPLALRTLSGGEELSEAEQVRLRAIEARMDLLFAEDRIQNLLGFLARYEEHTEYLQAVIRSGIPHLDATQTLVVKDFESALLSKP